MMPSVTNNLFEVDVSEGTEKQLDKPSTIWLNVMDLYTQEQTSYHHWMGDGVSPTAVLAVVKRTNSNSLRRKQILRTEHTW
jgi:hypothetical protein